MNGSIKKGPDISGFTDWCISKRNVRGEATWTVGITYPLTICPTFNLEPPECVFMNLVINRTQWPGCSAGLTVSAVTYIANVPIGWPLHFYGWGPFTVWACIWTYKNTRACSCACKRAISISALLFGKQRIKYVDMVRVTVIQHNDS